MVTIKVLCIVLAVLAALYLLIIMPRMTRRPDREPYLNVLYAHRGLHDNNTDAPENTMAAFGKAVTAGYGIECDVQLTKDGVPVIFHDFTLARVARYSDGEIPEDAVRNEDGSMGEIPRFEDFLKLVDGKVPLIIELKIERGDLSVCPKVDTLLRNYKGVYCIESFNPLGIIWYRRHRPEIFRGQLSDQFHRDKPEEFKGALYFILTNLFFNFLAKPDFIAFNRKYPKSLSMQLCRHLYKCVTAAWTIKDQEQLEAAKEDFDIYIFDSFIPN